MEKMSEGEEMQNKDKPLSQGDGIDSGSILDETSNEEQEVVLSDLLGNFSEQTGALFG